MRNKKLILILLVVTYVVSYIAVSVAGEYHKERPGKFVTIAWWPEALTSVDGGDRSLNTLGYLYYPLLHLDRAFIHRSFWSC